MLLVVHVSEFPTAPFSVVNFKTDLQGFQCVSRDIITGLIGGYELNLLYKTYLLGCGYRNLSVVSINLLSSEYSF